MPRSHALLCFALLMAGARANAQVAPAAAPLFKPPAIRSCLSRQAEVRQRPAPSYPTSLLTGGRPTNGDVLAIFWVTPDGAVDTASVSFPRLGESAFAIPIRQVLAKWRFSPALASATDSTDEVLFAEWNRCAGGKQGAPVAAKIQVPFTFVPPSQ